MLRFARFALLAAAAAQFGSSALAAPVAAESEVLADARILRALSLEKLSNLDFGRIIIGNVIGTQAVGIDPINGDLVGCTNGLTCLGPAQRASFFVHGTADARVRIYSGSSTLTNETGDTLVFSPSHPGSTLLPSWPAAGSTAGRGFFAVGGYISLSATTPEGVYQGTVDVTVDYM
jgi:hypothetical protein